MDKVTIFNDQGDDLTITPDDLHLQCILLRVIKDGDQANRRALLSVLKRINDLLNAVDSLTTDKTNSAKIARYQASKRDCETDVLYYGKYLHQSSRTIVQGELFADTPA